MLMTHRPERHKRQLPPGLRRFDWPMFLHEWGAAFHLLFGITLALAPYQQIYTTASQPVLDMGSRYLWAALMLLGGVALLWLARDLRPRALLLATALIVIPNGAVWLAAFIVAVLEGHGSALSVVIWPALYGPVIVAMLRVGLGKR